MMKKPGRIGRREFEEVGEGVRLKHAFLRLAGEKLRLRRAMLRLARARAGTTTIVDGVVYVKIRNGVVRRAGRKRKT